MFVLWQVLSRIISANITWFYILNMVWFIKNHVLHMSRKLKQLYSCKTKQHQTLDLLFSHFSDVHVTTYVGEAWRYAVYLIFSHIS